MTYLGRRMQRQQQGRHLVEACKALNFKGPYSMHLRTCQVLTNMDPNWNSGELFHTSVEVCACYRANYLYMFLIRRSLSTVTSTNSWQYKYGAKLTEPKVLHSTHFQCEHSLSRHADAWFMCCMPAYLTPPSKCTLKVKQHDPNVLNVPLTKLSVRDPSSPYTGRLQEGEGGKVRCTSPQKPIQYKQSTAPVQKQFVGYKCSVTRGSLLKLRTGPGPA